MRNHTPSQKTPYPVTKKRKIIILKNCIELIVIVNNLNYKAAPFYYFFNPLTLT